LILSAFTLLWFIIEYWLKISHGTLNQKITKRTSNHFKAYSGFIVLIFLLYLFPPIPLHHRGRVIGVLIGIAMLDVFINFLLLTVINKMNFTREKFKNVLIAGVGKTARNVEGQMTLEKSSAYQLKGFINCSIQEECAIGEHRVLGDLNDMSEYLEANPVDEIVIALPTHFTKEIRNVLKVADYHGIRTKYILDYKEMFGDQYTITKFGEINAVNIRQLPMDGRFALICKNTFDKIFSAIVLLLLLPLFLVLAILIKRDSPGPVFYCPIRIGRGGKPFKLYKFRSMQMNDDKGVLSTTENDPRITRLGRILRKYSLDELPQFINVLIGNMSVVGPRPHRRFLDRQLQETVLKYMIRHYVKPGITGWAQVNGWRGPSVTEQQKLERTKHDLHYIENWSILLDFKIVFLTIFSKKAHNSAF
jgi:putative colanic acid biosynthesis UDP-glucose lipid carrier transferase